MTIKATSRDLEQYCVALREAGLDAPWSRPGPLIEPKKTHVEPCLWRWAEIEPLVRRSAEFVSPDRGAERRILRLANPGVPERTSTHTISVAVQYLLPGEVAPAHRHTPHALRFMIHGRGAYTTVEGDKCAMNPGDLVLTPTQAWHDHGNEGTEPVIWADGLDSPVVRYLEILATQLHAEDRQPTGKIAGISARRFGAAGLRACGASAEGPQRLIHYRWETTSKALLALGELEPSPFDDVMMEYVDPTTGKPALPTIGCYIQMIRPGVRTRPHRHNACAVYHVVQGSGNTTIDGTRYQWQHRDFFAVPPWAQHQHANHGAEPAILFSMQDKPLLTALGLYREDEGGVTQE